MLTEARIRSDIQPAGLDWISALRGPAIRSLVEGGEVQLSLFDEKDLVEIRSEAYPGERLMVCRNPLLAERCAEKRERLLQATEASLESIAVATRRQGWRLSGKERIGERVGRAIGRHKMGKHFTWSMDAKGRFHYQRKTTSIASEAALDGLYVVRTSLSEDELDAPGAVQAYKRLSTVERAFRSLKTVDLKVRPVFHRTADRVRAHVLLCMLAYYIEWHMRQRLRPLLFDDEEGSQASRQSVVAPPASPKGRRPRPVANTIAKATRCRALLPCSRIWLPLPATPLNPACPGRSRSRLPPDRPHYRARPFSCWACHCRVPSNRVLKSMDCLFISIGYNKTPLELQP